MIKCIKKSMYYKKDIDLKFTSVNKLPHLANAFI